MILHDLMQAVCVVVLVAVVLGAWALWVTRNHRHDGQPPAQPARPDVSRLDHLDGVR